ncbi:MAG: hypothetical protein K5888_07600 [Lachnospiraceae bacterium]|nr:hypothetical protein [Lachnospiraceae bacterium]
MNLFKKDNFRMLAFFSGICFLYTVSLSHINVEIGGVLSASEHIRLYMLECMAAGFGFLLCPLILNKPDDRYERRRLILYLFSAVFVLTTLMLYFVTNGVLMYVSVVFGMLSMGVIAGYGYVIMSRSIITNASMGIIIAGGYVIAILLQFILQLELDLGMLVPALEIVICLLLVREELKNTGKPMMSVMADPENAGRSYKPNGRSELLRIMVIAICLLALSSYVDEQISVTFDVSSFFGWARLMIIPGYLLMGVAWSHQRIRIAPLLMLLSAVAALLMPVLLTDEAFYGLDICVFYFYIGICMTYLTLTFMRFAELSGNAFAAVLFRVTDNLMTVMFVLLGLGLIPAMAMIVVDVVLLVMIVALMWIGGDFESSTGYEQRFITGMASGYNDSRDAGSDDEKITHFAEKYGLTDRESEVLKLLLTKDEKGEVMAKELGVSRRGFVSFTTSIYQKTQTTSRIGLMQKYMSE